ncbi:type II toxin-antitoxin system PemK/MazF family toxin [Ruminococcus bromii]|jgi:mRNA-degrading endonuclease toxin of MazEF toxin-antitoxin module
MSKLLTLDELKVLIENAVISIKNMFQALLSRNTDKDNKRVSLLAYWLKDYSKYITEEDEFDPKKLIRYKRGDVLQVEFGYRIGRELGGRHYAVVIDVKNDFYSDTITVIPLISLKTSYKANRFSCILDKGIYELYSENVKRKIDKTKLRIDEMSKLSESKLEDCANGVITFDEYKKFLSSQGKVSQELNLQIATISKHLKAMDKLKPGTVANIGQITTISKKRIVNPVMKTHSLYGVRLAQSDLDKINEKLKALYTFEKNNS